MLLSTKAKRNIKSLTSAGYTLCVLEYWSLSGTNGDLIEASWKDKTHNQQENCLHPARIKIVIKTDTSSNLFSSHP